MCNLKHFSLLTWISFQTWISLAEYCLKDEDWRKIKQNCFNDRRNPDDDELDTQIVKVFTFKVE